MSGMVRLLFCHTCHSVDELPDFDGPPEYDHYLNYRVAQHQFPSDTPHRGLLAKCADDPKYINAAIDELENTVSPGQGSGLGQQLYDLRDNFGAEAMQCWKRHSRTDDCDDYRSEKKRLWLDTRADRKAEGMPTRREDRPNIWLCDHCPVHSMVQRRQRDAGLDV